MSITTYTTSADVRAVLGTSEEEIEDIEIDRPDMATELHFMLDEVSPLVATQFEFITDMDPGDRSALQSLFLRVVKLYASYCVASVLLRASSTYLSRRITDGKAESQRGDKMIEELKDGVCAGLIAIRRRLAVTLTGLQVGYNLSSFLPNPISAVGLAADPVTREE